MTALEWLAQPTSRLLTLSLLHFLWQGLAVCLMLVAIVELCNLQKATTRYACSLLALLAMTICPLATLAWLALERPAVGDLDIVNLSLAQISARISPRSHWLEAAQPYALAAWLTGVGLFGSRLLVGVIGISRLRRDRLPLPPRIAAVVENLGCRLQIDALPLVSLSKQVADAMAVGLIKPLVLIPAAWATELPLPMLEAVIAHELAHLVRRDLWVNLLQRIVETLLFYHPAVWWLSRRLRIERELCADELAVAATGDRIVYAKALEHIASQRQADIRPALAAFLRGETDMRLLQRVRNILGKPTDERSHLWPAGIIALVLPLGLWAATALGGAAIADDNGDEIKKPAIKRERDEGDGERRVTIRKKVPRNEVDLDVEVVEERVIKRDGKPIVEVQLGRKELREDQGDRRIDELTALVKRLAAQVERLQDEVASLRGSKASQKQPAAEAEQQLLRRRKEIEERDQLGARKRELGLAAEKIEATQRALAEKQKAIAELEAKEGKEAMEKKLERAREEIERTARVKERAAREKAEVEREKAEAAREKAEEAKEKVRKAIEDKIRNLKEDGEGDAEETEALTTKLLENARELLFPSPLDKPRIKERKEPR